MFRSCTLRAAGPARQRCSRLSTRNLATVSRNHRIVVVGGGAAGSAISHQLLRKGNFAQDDIAVVDPATWHYYQPGWTLVGGGIKNKEQLRQPMASLFDQKLKFYNTHVGTFHPENNFLTLENGDKINYEQLVVAPGISIDYGSVKGLPDALANPDSPVSTIYSYDYCDKVFRKAREFKQGTALFTQPAGVIKCAGAPQKIMWLSLDFWKRAGLYNTTSTSPIKINFATGLPVMFGVPKYSAKLEQLRVQRGVGALFEHDLVAINGKEATFVRPDGQQVVKPFDFLHVAPKNVPHAFVRNSSLANDAGFVDVHEGTMQHKKFSNVWSAGDSSSLPTSKTIAAVTSQAPILVSNLLRSLEGNEAEPIYDGYTSCPITTSHGELLLAEFKYGGKPKETFNDWFGIDQAVPRRAFYYLKKDFFPWVYEKYHVKGHWGGPKGYIK